MVCLATVMQDLWQMAAIVTKRQEHALVSLSGCTVLKPWLDSLAACFP